MAYLSHSTVREFRVNHASPSAMLVLKSALIAIGAAAVVLALSEASVAPPAATQIAAPLAKGDRLAAPQATASVVGSGAVVVDAAARTTSVAMGAEVPLSADSPMTASGR